MIIIMEDNNNDISVEVEIPSYLYDTDYDDVNWNNMPDEDDEEFNTFCSSIWNLKVWELVIIEHACFRTFIVISVTVSDNSNTIF